MRHWRKEVVLCLGILIALLSLESPFLKGSPPPFKVTITDKKKEITELVLPVDPKIRITLREGGFMRFGLTAEGKRLTFSSGSGYTHFRLDGQTTFPRGGQKQALPPTSRGKPRHGVKYTWRQGDIQVTQIQEIVPSKLPGKSKPGQKRKMDTVLFRYLIENKGNRTRRFGLRVRIDMYNWTTDGPLFAAPTIPGKVLNAMVIEGKQIPHYLMSLQKPNLKAPGNVAYFSFNLGRDSELPSKLIPTRHGSRDFGWKVQPTRISGDSDLILYWAEKPLPPNGKREIAFGYGQGLATIPENEGRVKIRLQGSLQPQKIFTIASLVSDPLDNQTLRLEISPDVKLLEGKRIQPVPLPQKDNASLVIWKARLLKPGTHLIRVHSSNGVTYGKQIVLQKAETPQK